MNLSSRLSFILIFGALAIARAADATVIDGLDELDAVLGISTSNAPLSRALTQINQGRIDTAIPDLQAHLATSPPSAAGEELLGVALAIKGRDDEGLKHLERAIELNPAQSTAYTKIGVIWLARGDVAKAESYFQKALSNGPGDRGAHQRLGLIAMERGQRAVAIDHFEKGIVGMSPASIGVKVELARLYNESGKPDAAAALLKPVVTPAVTDPAALIVLGTSSLMLGDGPAAITSFERARQLETDSPRPLVPLGIAYRLAGRQTDSLAVLKRAIELEPKSASNFYQLGETHLAMQNPAEGLKAYREAAKLGTVPNLQLRIAQSQMMGGDRDGAVATLTAARDAGQLTAQGFQQLGALHEEQGRLDQAQAAYEAMIKQSPDASAGYAELGRLLALRREYDRAAQTLEAGLRVAPQDPRLMRGFAAVQARRGDYDGAIATANRLVSISGNADNVFLMASLLDEAGRDSDAATAYDRLLGQQKDHVGALNNLAVIRSDAGRHRDAVELAQRASTLAPNDAAVADTYGWAVYKSGEPKRAADVLTAGVRSEPRYAPIYYHLAVVQAELGNNAAARTSVERALSISGEFPEAAAARTLLTKLPR